MKFVKIALGVIIGLSTIFFLTGLVIKEIMYDVEITIDKPIEQVFSEFKNVEKQQKWIPEITSVEVVNKNPQEIGSKYLFNVVNGERNLDIKMKVLAFVPNERITYRSNSDVIVRTESFIFTKEGTGTKILQRNEVRSISYMLACTIPWFKSKLVNGSQEHLQSFKKYMESK